MIAGSLLTVACAAGDADALCGATDAGVPPLDAPDSAERWDEIASSADGDVAEAASALAVVARQVAALGPEASVSDRAALALRPAVAEHLAAVHAEVDGRCG